MEHIGYEISLWVLPTGTWENGNCAPPGWQMAERKRVVLPTGTWENGCISSQVADAIAFSPQVRGRMGVTMTDIISAKSSPHRYVGEWVRLGWRFAGRGVLPTGTWENGTAEPVVTNLLQ